MSLEVDVQRACDAPGVPGSGRITRWARAAAEAVRSHDASLCVRIVDETEGAELNRSFRKRDGATNVLSFPFDAGSHVRPPLLGDVVICAPVVAREAREQGKALDDHYAHLVIHGVLHLLGHDHGDEDQAALMEGLERRVLAGLGVADPYAAAGAPGTGDRP